MTLWKRHCWLLPWRRRAAERDMQEELRSIAEMAGPGELGNLTLAAEDARAQWGWTRLEQAGQDLRYALRTLGKSPGFTAAVVLSLALGIGANTALFTLINTVMWKMLPVRDPEHLFVLGQQSPASVSNEFTFRQYQLIRDQNQVMDLASYARVPLNVTVDGVIEPTVEGQLVSGGYFPLLGVRSRIGRLFGPDDDRTVAGHPVAVITDGYWNRRFARDPAIVGRQISISGVSFSIVGVTPPEFFGVEVGAAPKIFVPVTMQPVVMPTTVNLLQPVRPPVLTPWLRVLGRLQHGVPLAQAAARLGMLHEQLEWRPRSKFTGQFEDRRLVISSAAAGLSDLRTQFSQPLIILVGVVGIVLLMACVNTGNLVLARSATRRAEFSLRLALGAGRTRLVRQVLVEGLVLAGLACVLGILVAFWATQALVAFVSVGRNPIMLDLSPDLRVLVFAAAVSMLAGLLFGSVPATRAWRSPEAMGIRQDLASRGAVVGPGGPGNVLVVVQVALALVLLVGAGLFVRTLQNLNRQASSSDQRGILIARVEPRGSGNRDQGGAKEKLDRAYRALIEQVERIPGVQSASLARTSPLAPIAFAPVLKLPTGQEPRVLALMVYPRYFSTMGIPIVRGRDFNGYDLRPDSPLVGVVNEAFVRHILNGQEPLGDQHGVVERLGWADRERSVARQRPLNIVGVVRDSRYPALREATPPIMYQTFLQAYTRSGQMVLHVKVGAPSDRIAREVRGAVQAIDSEVPMFELHTLADELDGALVRERLLATLSGVFGIVALVLISTGLYGLMAFAVSRRTAEIGLRVALGATSSRVRWMIGRQALSLVLAGIVIGLPVAWIAGWAASRQLSSILFELTPADPITMIGSIAALVAVAMCACMLPAHRAARIDPIVALRNE
ncbi:MAG: ABC transporter permease [Bryobacteraceae bacterium]